MGQLRVFGTPSRWGSSLSSAAASYGLDLASLPCQPGTAAAHLCRTHVSPELQALILKMTSINPEDRPSAAKVLEDTCFDAVRSGLEQRRAQLAAAKPAAEVYRRAQELALQECGSDPRAVAVA